MKIESKQLKLFCVVSLVLNLVSVVLGMIFYALSTTRFFWLWNLQGIIMFISWILNLVLVYMNDRVLRKSDSIGKKINMFSYSVLGFIIIAMVLFIFYSLTLSFIQTPLIITFVFSLLGLIGIAIFGILLAYFDIKNLENRGVWKFE